MLLNLASDKPFFYNRDFVFFDRKNLENQLPSFFKENFSTSLEKLYVITGPGYFSSTRVGVEFVNILLFLKQVKEVLWIDKISFFKNLDKSIYLFSGNKSKWIFLNQDKKIKIVSKSELDCDVYFEELFELKYPCNNPNIVFYKDILKNYKKFNWNKLSSGQWLKPFYVFEPIIG